MLELGSGVGLPGFISSRFCNKIWLTDGKREILNLLNLNKEYLKTENVETFKLSWGTTPTLEFIESIKPHQIDIVIGADIMFWP